MPVNRQAALETLARRLGAMAFLGAILLILGVVLGPVVGLLPGGASAALIPLGFMWLVVGLWQRRHALQGIDRARRVMDQGSPDHPRAGQMIPEHRITRPISRLTPLERYVRLLGVTALFGVALLAIGVVLGSILRFIPEATGVVLIVVGLMSIVMGLSERHRVLKLVDRGRPAVDGDSASPPPDGR